MKFRIHNIIKTIKYALQRAFRGYDDVQVWGLCDSFIDTYTKILKRLRQKSGSYPFQFKTIEDWHAVLDEMILHLEGMNEDSYDTEKRIYEDWPDFHSKCYQNRKKMNEHKEEFFKLFNKYFYDLWA